MSAWIWLIALCGTVPAIAAGVFSPFELSSWAGKFAVVDSIAAELKYTPILGLITGAAFSVRSPYRLAALTPLLLLQLAYFFPKQMGLEVGYCVASLAAVLLFVSQGWRWAVFGSFVGLLAIYWWFEPALAIYHLGGFLILIATTRFVWVAIEQNRGLLKRLATKDIIKAGVISFLYWCPLLAFLVVGQMVVDPLVGMARAAIYQSQYLAPENGKEQDVRADVTRAVHQALDTAQKKANDGLSEAERKANGKAEELASHVMTEVNAAIPRADDIEALRGRKCKFYQLKCHAENYTKKRARQAYDRSRSRVIADLQARVDKVRSQAGTATAKIAELRQQVRETTSKQKEMADAVLDGVFKALDSLHLLLLALLIFSGIKSFLVVFARVALAPTRIPFHAFSDVLKPYEAGSIRKLPNNSFTLDEPGTYWNARCYPAAGQAPAIAVPQPSSCLLARLASGTYFANTFQVTSRSRAQFTIAADRSFVRWTLGKGEVVAFHWRDFVAANTSVTFKTRLNLRLPGLFLGRFLFPCAEGPGELFLATDGAPILRRHAASQFAQPIDRLIAYRTDTEFNIVARTDLANIFLNGVHIKKHDADAPIIYESQGETGLMRGIARWIMTFLIPL